MEKNLFGRKKLINDGNSTIMNIPCNASIMLTADGGVGASYQWFDSTATVISTDSFLIVGPGTEPL